jgi:hypothetical protein
MVNIAPVKIVILGLFMAGLSAGPCWPSAVELSEMIEILSQLRDLSLIWDVFLKGCSKLF